jgi:hypothetical protein
MLDVPTTGADPRVWGAECDNATDDTIAIQTWLNRVANFKLRAPAGTCLFSAPLFVPYANNYAIDGAGPGATVFKYTGPDYNASTTAAASWSAAATAITLASTPSIITTALANGYKVTAWDTTTGKMIGRVSAIGGSTMTVPDGAAYASSGSSDAIHLTTDLLTINDTGHGGERAVSFADFSVLSATALTGGFAIHAHGLFASTFRNVWTDTTNSADTTTHGNLCGGQWFDGAGGVDVLNPQGYSAQSTCGDGIAVNSALGGAAELRIVGGQIYGFANGAHMAGGFGGMRFDQTDISKNGNGAVIDNAIAAVANREFDLGSTAAIDGSLNDGILVNDTISSGGTIHVGGWVASSQSGHGVNVQHWTNGDVEITSHKIYNNCLSGVLVADTSTYVTVSAGAFFNKNGNSGISVGCPAAQAANPNDNKGIRATSTSARIVGNFSGANNGGVTSTGNAGLTSNTIGASVVGHLETQHLLVYGSKPTVGVTGGCVLGTQTGGNSAGMIPIATGCTGALTLALPNSPAINGLACTMNDITTPANAWKPTAMSLGQITFTGTAASGDSLTWSCISF